MDEVYVEDSSTFQEYEWAYNSEFDETVMRVDATPASASQVHPNPIRRVSIIATVSGTLTKQVRDAIADAYHSGVVRGVASVKGTTVDQIQEALCVLAQQVNDTKEKSLTT